MLWIRLLFFVDKRTKAFKNSYLVLRFFVDKEMVYAQWGKVVESVIFVQ